MSDIITDGGGVQPLADTVIYEPNRAATYQFLQDVGFAGQSATLSSCFNYLDPVSSNVIRHKDDSSDSNNKLVLQRNICRTLENYYMLIQLMPTSSQDNVVRILHSDTTLFGGTTSSVISSSGYSYSSSRFNFSANTSNGTVFSVTLSPQYNLIKIKGFRIIVSRYYPQTTSYNSCLFSISKSSNFSSGIKFCGWQSNNSFYIGSNPYNAGQSIGFWNSVYPNQVNNVIGYNKLINRIDVEAIRDENYYNFTNTFETNAGDATRVINHNPAWDLNDYISAYRPIYICLGNYYPGRDNPFAGYCGYIYIYLFFDPISSIQFSSN